jgi:hypothetical protein
MVGRVELITKEQRKILTKISESPADQIQRDAQAMATEFASKPTLSTQEFQQLASGAKPLSSIVSVPATYQAYLDLGRFRNALLLDAAKNHPTMGLTNFMATYGIHSFKPVDTLAPETVEKLAAK